jgi:IS66 Orf2 like protein
MIQITAQMRVLVAIEPVDGRRGIDSLARLCQEKLAEDPFSGCVFVFRSRRGTSIRLLTYDSCDVPDYVECEAQRPTWVMSSPPHST